MLHYQSENFGRAFDFRFRYHDRFVVPVHIHEFSEILYCKSGTMTMYIGSQKHLVPAGHVAVVMPNDIHAYTDETPCHVLCAVFSNDFITGFFRTLGDRMPAEPIFDISACRGLLDALEATAFDDTLRLTGLLNLLYAEYLRATPTVPRTKESAHMVKAAIEYVAQNFRQDITLSGMAKQLGYHEKYLSSALHALTQMNFCQFLGAYRVDYAKQLLRDESARSRSVAEIAHEAGFSSINTFNRVFRQHTGLTPSEYRHGD